MGIATKTERIDIRISKENKCILERAAEISNTSISEYILNIVLKRAQLDIVENEKIILSNKERDQILSILENPSEPNDKLVTLFK